MGVGRTDRRPPATASALARLAPDCRLGTLVQLSGDDDRVWFCPLAHRCRCSLVGQRHIFIRTIYMHIHSLAYTRVLVGARAPSQSTYVCIRCIFLAAAHPVTSSVATVGSISSRHELISTGTRPPRDKCSIHRPSTQHSFPLWLLRAAAAVPPLTCHSRSMARVPSTRQPTTRTPGAPRNRQRLVTARAPCDNGCESDGVGTPHGAAEASE